MTISDLKLFIQRYIRENGRKEITGPILQNVLLETVDTLSSGSVGGVTVEAYYTSGSKIATITVGNVPVDIYTSETDLSDYATKKELNEATQSVKGWADGKFLTEHQDLSNYPTKTEVTSSINAVSESIHTEQVEQNRLISELQSRGRYLTIWNCTTGKPETEPFSGIPYEYKTGDYFIVGTVGITNYKPEGNAYTGDASTTPETKSVDVNDSYLYDGASWHLLRGSDINITFASIGGQPTDNINLANALNAKQDVIGDLEEIRQGANLGKTAAQPVDVTSSINAVSQSVKDWVEAKNYSSVQFTQSLGSGTKIGEINIDGIATEIYQSGDGTDNTLRSFLFNSQSVSLTALDCSVTNNYSSINADTTLAINVYPSPGRSISVTIHNTDNSNKHTITIPSTLGNYGVYCNGSLGGSFDIPASSVGDLVITEMNGNLYIRTSMEVSGGGGTSNYNDLNNKPSINGVELSGNKSLSDLGINIPDVTGKEDTNNKVTTLDASSTDTQYPSAKCVYDLVGNVESLLQTLR